MTRVIRNAEVDDGAWRFARTLDATGVASWSLTVPAAPQLAGSLVVFQSIELGSQVTSLSNPALVVIES